MFIFRDRGEIVRPRIKLTSCLEALVQSELVDQFYSSAIKGKTTASKLVDTPTPIL